MEHRNELERQVVAMLRVDWRDLLRCTTIEQAMERLGIPFSDAERLCVAGVLRRKSHDLEGMRWPLPTYVLTNPERLVARHVLRSLHPGGEVPPPSKMTERLEVPREVVEAGHDALRWLGFLRTIAAQGLSGLLDAGFYEDQRAILNDACGWSDEPIRVVMERGKCLQVTPETAWYLRGGG